MNNRAIFKYHITKENNGLIEMPEGSNVVSCQLQNGIITIWAIVDESKPLVKRQFDVYGTGWDVDARNTFIGTVQDNDGLVWHIFEINT